MVHVNDPLTRKGSMLNGVGGENKNSSSSSSSLDNEMGHLLKPALSRFYSKPDLELVYLIIPSSLLFSSLLFSFSHKIMLTL